MLLLILLSKCKSYLQVKIKDSIMEKYRYPLKIFGYVTLFYFFINTFGFLVSGVLVASLIYFTDGFKDLKYASKIVKRDVSCFWFFRTKIIPNLVKNNDKSPYQLFKQTAKRHPDKKALIAAETGRYLTYKDIEIFMNKIGHVFKKDRFQTW